MLVTNTKSIKALIEKIKCLNVMPTFVTVACISSYQQPKTPKTLDWAVTILSQIMAGLIWISGPIYLVNGSKKH